MYNILIFGTGSTSAQLINLLNNEVNIVAFVDNDENKWGKLYYGKSIIKPIEINKYDFHYILIASQFNEEILNQLIDLNIDKSKIFQYFKFLDSLRNHFIQTYKSFLKRDGMEVMATWISYVHWGLNENTLIKKVHKFSSASQDLYYDYKIIKYLLEEYPEKMSDIRYVIIGLSYYAFQYDMSLSAMSNKTLLYYPILKDGHHFNGIEKTYSDIEMSLSIANKVFNKNKEGKYILNCNRKDFSQIKDKEKLGEKQANIDCNKNYPETVKENIQIFRDYLYLLKIKNIKPIVVVFPASKYYTSHFSKRIEDEFHSIIASVRKEYDFQYIDYFRSDLFTDEDFTDISHLNPKGAEKFTIILNDIVEW